MSLRYRLQFFLAQNSTFVALIGLVAVFAAINPRFLTVRNSETIILQVAELGLVALPLALLVMSGAVDLSVGSIASVAAVTSALVMAATGDTAVGVVAGVVFGLFAGTINGLLVAYLGLNPIVVTLGFLSVWGGVALWLTSGATVVDLPDSFRALGTLNMGPMRLQILVLIVATALAWWVLNRRPFGRQLLATGGNARAARLMGISPRSVRLRLFILTGGCAALAGVMLSAKLQAASPTIGSGMEVQVLTVVLLGGVAFEGGSGRISGVIAGLLFVGVLRNGLVIVGVSQFLQTVLIGATLVIAVTFDKTIQGAVRSLYSRAVKNKLPQTQRLAAHE